MGLNSVEDFFVCPTLVTCFTNVFFVQQGHVTELFQWFTGRKTDADGFCSSFYTQKRVNLIRNLCKTITITLTR